MFINSEFKKVRTVGMRTNFGEKSVEEIKMHTSVCVLGGI